MRAKKPMIVDGVELWACSGCHKWLTAAMFYKDKRRANGLKSECKQCHTAGNIRTRDKDTARDANREHMRRARSRDPEKFRARDREASRRRPRTPQQQARYLLNLAVRRGEVFKPNVCEACHLLGKVTGHHPDYSKPLEVIWLCYECHGKEHRH